MNNLKILNLSKVNIDREAWCSSIARISIERVHKVWIVHSLFLQIQFQITIIPQTNSSSDNMNVEPCSGFDKQDPLPHPAVARNSAFPGGRLVASWT